MCLIALAVGSHPRYPLVIASNRDEFFDRPTATLSEWRTVDGHTVWSGRDLRDGGTWLGFAPSGRFAMLTNVRQGPIPGGARSRGALVLQWLQSDRDAETFHAHIDASQYAGFNLIVGHVQQGGADCKCFYITNRPLAQQIRAQAAIKSIAFNQIIGLSNASLDAPWPKTLALKSALRRTLLDAPDEQALCDAMLAQLRDATPYPDAELPQTGVPLDLERSLSSAFVARPGTEGALVYGTRCSTLALWSHGNLAIKEWTYTPTGGVSLNAASLATLRKPWPQVAHSD
jgi:uncharacterized protein with NRDE domain